MIKLGVTPEVEAKVVIHITQFLDMLELKTVVIDQLLRHLRHLVIYHLLSALFSPSSSVDHTPFQSSINLRTRPCIPYQSHRVLNDNSMISDNLEYVQ